MNRFTPKLPVRPGCRLLAMATVLLMGSALTAAPATAPAAPEGIHQEEMVLDGRDFPPFQDITDPRGPWHELWPRFCTPWEVIDWVDNGSRVLDVCDYILLETPDQPDPTWWHVENVTLTVHFDEVDGPYEPPVYAEWLDPLPPDPQDFVPIGPWHMIYPEEIYCQEWFCFDWQDNGNGVLDFCDLLFFELPTGEVVVMHVRALATDITVRREDPPPPDVKVLDGPDFPPFEPIPDPRGPWHELWPNFCTQWEVIDWVDNSNGFLDFCDYILLEEPGTEPMWWHVENVTLTVHFDEVEGPFQPPVYAEWLEPLPPDPADFIPIGPWHMIYPEEIFCQEWFCFDWQDNGNGVLDFCDLLFFELPTGEVVVMHVRALATDITVKREDPPPPPPPEMVLDGPQFPPFEPIPDPRGPWHELWPRFCTPWEVVDWDDNGSGLLDCSDYILLETPGTQPTWYHVENVTLTVFFDEVQGPIPPPVYAEWLEPLPPDPRDFVPIGPWHMIYPPEIYCQEWFCRNWDDNGNGVLDFCDRLEFVTPSGEVVFMHVGGLATDITVEREDPPACPEDLDGSGTVAFGDIVVILRNWGCEGPDCEGDANRDCRTNFQDILAVLAAWGRC